jgi:hypothetical protein
MIVMKQIIKAAMLCVISLVSVVAIAQDSTNVSGGDSSGSWYRQPWIWVVGGVVFLLLIIAMLRGSNRQATNERATVTRHKDI